MWLCIHSNIFFDSLCIYLCIYVDNHHQRMIQNIILVAQRIYYSHAAYEYQ